MAIDKDDGELERLVIQELPIAGAALELARQLADYLPIRSPDDLIERFKGQPVTVRGVRIDMAALDGLLPEEVFPIEDRHALVRGTLAALRVGSSAMRHGGGRVRDEALAGLAADLAPVAAAPVGVALFNGPSAFGSTRSDGKEN